MKKLLLTVLFVGLAVGTAQAGVTNPETFETYALTDDFENTSIGDGAEWYTGWFNFSGAAPTDYEIINTSPGNATKVLSTPAGGNETHWWGRLTDDYQILKYDVKLAASEGVYNRSMVAQNKWANNAYWEMTAQIMLKRTASGPEAVLYSGGLGGLGSEAVMPGQAALTWGVWYTVEMHTDLVANKVKARFGPTGGAMNGWTPWLGYDPAYDNYNSHRFLDYSNVQYDNISLDVPEPATLALLGAGSLLLLKRKRKS